MSTTAYSSTVKIIVFSIRNRNNDKWDKFRFQNQFYEFKVKLSDNGVS